MAARAYVYGGSVPATRPAADFTPRVVPDFPEAMIPLEARHILWQK
jgi:starch phosphorylase